MHTPWYRPCIHMCKIHRTVRHMCKYKNKITFMNMNIHTRQHLSWKFHAVYNVRLMCWRLKQWRQHLVYVSVCVFVCVSLVVCVCTPLHVKGLIISCFQGEFCRPLVLVIQWPKWLYANSSWPQCTLCLISMNMTLCDRMSVCYKIWLLRRCRIDEHSSFAHTNTHAKTSFILWLSEGFVLKETPPTLPLV